MQYIKQEISDFTYTNLTEDTLPYDPDNPYTAGEYVLYGTYIFKSVTSSTGKDPILFENVYWVRWSVSNRFAMLDLASNTKSEFVGGNIVVEFNQNRMQTFAIGNYEAAYIKVEVIDYDNTTVVWSYQTNSSVNDNVTDYFSYMYEEYNYEIGRGIKIYTPYWSNKVRITFYKSVNADRTACGYIVGGNGVSMGRTLYGVNFAYMSFALKETDDFGTLSIVKRAVQDIIDFETIIPNADLQVMRREIKKVYNDILVFILDDEDTTTSDNIMTLGTIESASVVLDNPQMTTMSFSIIEAV